MTQLKALKAIFGVTVSKPFLFCSDVKDSNSYIRDSGRVRIRFIIKGKPKKKISKNKIKLNSFFTPAPLTVT